MHSAKVGASVEETFPYTNLSHKIYVGSLIILHNITALHMIIGDYREEKQIRNVLTCSIALKPETYGISRQAQGKFLECLTSLSVCSGIYSFQFQYAYTSLELLSFH